MITAVEWLIDEIDMQYPEINVKNKEWMIDKAKEMEKEQIIQTWYDCKMSVIEKNPTTAEQYYNETFKQQEK